MLCPGCFEEKGPAPICPSCEYDESPKRSAIILAHHTELNNGRYIIGKLLGKPGGFGITYLGWDKRLLTKVAVKEYLPRDLSGRDIDHITVFPHSRDDAETFAYGLTRFVDEARTLAQLDHPSVVRVRDFFEENGTAYLVMDYYDGLTLSEYISHQPAARLSESQAINVISPILDGLREVHAKGFLHRDIKPQNIYLTIGNRPILLDFGAARFAMGERSRSLSVVLSEGYAPIEQYQRNGKQGPWTDVYGAAATLYACVTGTTPPTAMDRVGVVDDLPFGEQEISKGMISAIQGGMRSDYLTRIQTIEEFQTFLFDSHINSTSSGQVFSSKENTIAVNTFISPEATKPLNKDTFQAKTVADQPSGIVEKQPIVGSFEPRKLLVPLVAIVVLGLAVALITYLKTGSGEISTETSPTHVHIENQTPVAPNTSESQNDPKDNAIPSAPQAPSRNPNLTLPGPNAKPEVSPGATEPAAPPAEPTDLPELTPDKPSKREVIQNKENPEEQVRKPAERPSTKANKPSVQPKPKPKPKPKRVKPDSNNDGSSGPSALDLKIRREADKFFNRR
jgi:serine/threonine protein kinase